VQLATCSTYFHSEFGASTKDIDKHNDRPKRFVWTAKAADILGCGHSFSEPMQAIMMLEGGCRGLARMQTAFILRVGQ
jgi:hypothetical protein